MSRTKLVYRPKTQEERERREARTKAYMGTPYVQLQGKPPQHKVLFSSEGRKIRVMDVEMVHNDARMMDHISDYGQDGPLYKDTLDDPIMKTIYNYTTKAAWSDQ